MSGELGTAAPRSRIPRVGLIALALLASLGCVEDAGSPWDMAGRGEIRSDASPDGFADLALSCGSGRVDGDESDVDCGGSCPPCKPGLRCRAAPDCASRVCVGNSCASSTCKDGVRNGEESDVDCGQGCPSCGEGKVCRRGSDCLKEGCVSGRCAAVNWEMRTFAVGAGPTAIAMADVTGDGLRDIVVGVKSDLGFGLRVLRRAQGDTYQLLPGLDYSPGAGGNNPMVVADLNRDGRLDAVTSSWLDEKVWVLFNQGGGMFGQATSYKVTGGVLGRRRSLAAGDFDGDGDVDVAVGGIDEGLTLLQNRGDGVLAVNILDFPCSPVRAADIDRDGTTDLVYDQGGDGVMVRTKRITVQRVWAVWSGLGRVEDFNGDGWPDAAAEDYVALNDQRGNLLPPRSILGLDLVQMSGQLTSGDWNGDGRRDWGVFYGDWDERGQRFRYSGALAFGTANGGMAYSPDMVLVQRTPDRAVPIALGAGDAFGDQREEMIVGYSYHKGGAGDYLQVFSFK